MISKRLHSFQVLLNALSIQSAMDIAEHLVIQEMIQKLQFEEVLSYITQKLSTTLELLTEETQLKNYNMDLVLDLNNNFIKTKKLKDHLVYYFANGLDEFIIQD